jgi:cell division protein FtsB
MLVRQFKSLQRLLKSKEQQIVLLNENGRELRRECLISQQIVADVDALREVNQQLTDRVLELEQQVEDLEFEIKLRQEGVY